MCIGCTLLGMNLDEWMTAKEVTDDALAAQVNADRTTISRIRRGKQRPSWELAARLVDVSGGEISADSFLPKIEGSASPDKAVA